MPTKLRKLSSGQQKGFAALEPFFLIIILIIAAGVGFYVWQSQKSPNRTPDETNNTSQPSSANKQTNLAFVDKKKLPSGWGVDILNADTVVVANDGLGGDPAKSCFVQVTLTVDKKANPNDSQYVKTQEQKMNQMASSNKGYAYESLTASPMSLATTSGTKALQVFYNRVIAPGSDSTFSYEKDGYLVLSGRYYAAVQSCRSQDFTQADMALHAITVNL